MAERPSVLAAFRASNRGHWIDSGVWLGFTLVGGLLPLWGGSLLLAIVSRGDRWLDLISNGELALYSAAFIASAVHLIAKEGDEPFVQRPFFLLLAVCGLLFAGIVFAGMATIRYAFPTLSLDRSVILWLSVPLFGASVVYAFVMNLLDNVRMSPDVQSAVAAEGKRLEEGFDRLGEHNGN